MAENTVNRESLATSLEERYKNQWAGGAYNVHDSVLTNGTSAVATGDSIYDKMYTVTPGFVLKQPLMQSEFKEVANGNKSAGLSLLAQGIDTTPYL